MTGAFIEMGPYRKESNGQLARFNQSWTELGHQVFFTDPLVRDTQAVTSMLDAFARKKTRRCTSFICVIRNTKQTPSCMRAVNRMRAANVCPTYRQRTLGWSICGGMLPL